MVFHCRHDVQTLIDNASHSWYPDDGVVATFVGIMEHYILVYSSGAGSTKAGAETSTRAAGNLLHMQRADQYTTPAVASEPLATAACTLVYRSASWLRLHNQCRT
jgi:hypothetical protein